MMNKIILNDNKMIISAKCVSSVTDAGDFCLINRNGHEIKLRGYVDMDKMRHDNITSNGEMAIRFKRIFDILARQTLAHVHERRYLYIFISCDGIVDMDLTASRTVREVKKKGGFHKRTIRIDLGNQSIVNNNKTLSSICSLISNLEKEE